MIIHETHLLVKFKQFIYALMQTKTTPTRANNPQSSIARFEYNPTIKSKVTEQLSSQLRPLLRLSCIPWYINIPTKLITQAGPHLTSQDLGPPTSTRTGTGFELICVLWCSKLRLKFIYQKHLLFKKNPHILDLLLQVLFMRRRRYSGANKNCCHDRG